MIWRSVFVLIAYLATITLEDEIICSTTCGTDSSDPSFKDCWQRNENFAIQQIISAVNNFTGVEIMFHRWKINNHQPINVSAEMNEIISRAENLGMMNNGPLNSSSMELIIGTAVQTVLNWTVSLIPDTINDNKYNYDYVCPIPSDYVGTMWMYLFICVTVILALTLLYMAIYVYRIRKQLNKRRLL